MRSERGNEKMATARKGNPIVCSQGHVVGHVLNDVADTDTIPANGKFFGIELDVVNFRAGQDGHDCAKCGERVTVLRDGHYQIRTGQGWFGRLDQ
jgi:hypothetical protein